MSDVTFRVATPDDVPRVNEIAKRSVRATHNGFYSDEEIEKGAEQVYGVDWELVRDGTYFVAELDGEVIGAGGWSFREAIGSSRGPDAPASARLDPARDAAHIRAFYVDPAYGRRGLAKRFLELSEDAVRKAGFKTVELIATPPAQALAATLGYEAVGDYATPLRDGTSLRHTLMRKSFADPTGPDPDPQA